MNIHNQSQIRMSPNRSPIRPNVYVGTHPTPVFINETPTPKIVQVPAYKSVLPNSSLMSFVNPSSIVNINDQK